MTAIRFSECHIRRARVSTAQTIALESEYEIVHEKGRKGYFMYGVFVLEDKDDLFAMVLLDDYPVLDDTHDDLEAAAAGDLNLDQGDNAGNLIHIPDSSASYYTVVIDAHAKPWPFHQEFEARVRNKNTSTGYKLQSALILYALHPDIPK